jgi:hypothetical protein
MSTEANAPATFTNDVEINEINDIIKPIPMKKGSSNNFTRKVSSYLQFSRLKLLH